MKELKELVISESSAPFIVVSLQGYFLVQHLWFEFAIWFQFYNVASRCSQRDHTFEILLYSHNSLTHLICLFHAATPLDCEVSLWSSWGLCLGPCSRGGVRHRTRYILLRPANSGTPCPELEEQAECVPHSCMKLQ